MKNTEAYEQTLVNLAETLVNPERYGKIALQTLLPGFENVPA